MTHRADPDRPGVGGEAFPAAARGPTESEVLPTGSGILPTAPSDVATGLAGGGRPVRAAPRAHVPLMDPRRVYADWGPAAESVVVEILRSHAYVKGEHVAGLEHEFAALVGTEHAVAVDSCTDALFLVLRAVLNERPAAAREVILPTFTFVATAGAVVNAGGLPVFADVDAHTHNLDPASVAALVSEHTAAVIPVHLFGAPADIPAIREAVGSQRYAANGSNGAPAGSDVFVLEDAAQAVHARVGERRAGALADAGTFSFYPSKNLGAAGDGGIVTTDDGVLAQQVRALRDHGQTCKLYDHEHVGTNSRMDEIQAAVLRLKLPWVEPWTAARREIARRYDEAFAGTAVRPQALLPGSESAYHLYTVRVERRDEVAAALDAAGVGSGVYYPLPLHRQTCFRRYESASCPNADALAASVLSLPCYPGLTPGEQGRVIEALRAAIR